MSTDYQRKKQFYDNLLTVYGRKPVLEVLRDASIPVYKLHLAENNRDSGIVGDILRQAEKRDIPVAYHSRDALSRISRNRRQDQGVAADLQCPGYRHYRAFLRQPGQDTPFRLIALDGITNPQNLGMIIRSVSASPFSGILLPARGCAALTPLVIKASAGTLFHCTILRCDNLSQALGDFAAAPADICVLTGSASEEIATYKPGGNAVYVLGNETDGVSEPVTKLATHRLKIPMANGVESLNVAVAAALIAFQGVLG